MRKGDLVRLAAYTPTLFIFIRKTVEGMYVLQNAAGQIFNHYGEIYL